MKRFMMLAALFGAMTLGACVDNEESQSVTDIRDAKTEELKSLAALNNAQAEAAKIAANAEAALKAAEAAYQQALAEQVAAQTALLEVEAQLAAIKVELKGAELEAKLAELEALKAEYNQRITEAQAAIAKAEAQLEIDLAKAEYDLLVAQKDVLDATQDLEAAQKINYMSLYNAYSMAISNLNNAKGWLVSAQKRYTAVEEDILAGEEAAAETIESYKEVIAETEEQIALYQTRVDAFAEYVTLTDEELEAKIEEKEAEHFPLYTNYMLARQAYNDYFEANPLPKFPEDVKNYENYMNNWCNAFNNNNGAFGPWQYCTDVEMNPLVFVENEEMRAIGYYLPNADPYYEDFYPVFEFNNVAPYASEIVEVEYTFEGCEDVETATYRKYAPAEGWVINETNFNAYLKMWGQKLEEHWSKTNMDRFQKQLDEMVKKANSTEKGSEGEFTAYKTAVADYVKAKEERDVAQKEVDKTYNAYWDVYDAVKDPMNPTEAETKALDEAWAIYEKSVETWRKADEKFYSAEETLNETRMLKEWVEEDIKNVESWIADLKEEYEIRKGDYEDACAAYEYIKESATIAADEKTYEEWNNYYAELVASDEYVTLVNAVHEYNEIIAEIEALKEAYAADDDYESVVNLWTDQIEQLEANIEYYNEQIADLEEQIADPSHEETLASLQEAIEMAKLRVAAAQKAADEAKAKLDAALAE